MVHRKKLDILVLIGLLVVAVLYASLTRDMFIGKAAIAGVIYTIPPVIYLEIRRKKDWPKIIISTLVFGGLFGFLFEFIAEYTKAYSVISTIFPFKIFGVLPLDNVLGHMMMTLYTVVFYEHFVDREINHHISKHLKYAVLPAVFAIIAVIFIYFYKPTLLNSEYPYFYMGLAAIIPPIFLGFTRPKFIKNMAITAIYFFFFYFVAEVFAVSYNYWIYPGNNYVGWVSFFGITFPFEELFFWMMFYAASLVSYYELFIDDHTLKKRRKR